MAAQTVNKVAAGLIIFRRMASEVQYLMLQASYGDFHWSPPKGHLDPGETELEAAWRETREEAGYTKDNLRLFDSFKATLNYQVRGKPKRVVYWLSELTDIKAPVCLSDEHKDYKWLNFDDVMVYAQFDDMKNALKEANDFVLKL